MENYNKISISKLLLLMHGKNIYASIMEDIIDKKSTEYKKMATDVTDVVNKKIKFDDKINHTIKVYIEDAIFLGTFSSEVSMLFEEYVDYNDAIELINSMNIIIMSYVRDIVQLKKKEIYDRINKPKYSKLTPIYSRELDDSTKFMLADITSTKDKHLLNMYFNDIHHTLNFIDKYYTSNLNCYVIHAEHSAYNVHMTGIMPLTIVKTRPNIILNINELTDPIDIEKIAKMFYTLNQIEYDYMKTKLSNSNNEYMEKLRKKEPYLKMDLDRSKHLNYFIKKIQDNLSAYMINLKDQLLAGIESKKRIISMRIGLIDISNVAIHDDLLVGNTGNNIKSHAVIVLIDKKKRTIEYFESNGDINPPYDTKLVKECVMRMIKDMFGSDKPFNFGDIITNTLFVGLISEHNMNGGQLTEQELDKISNILKNKYEKIEVEQNKYTKLRNKLLQDNEMKYFANVKILNDDFYNFLNTLKSYGKDKLDRLQKEFIETDTISLDSKYKDIIINILKNIYRMDLSKYTMVYENSILIHRGLGPQALTMDEYCLIWTILASIIKATHPDISILEIQTMLKSELSDVYLDNDPSYFDKYKEDMKKYLELKYTPVANNIILNRIEKFIMWIGKLASFIVTTNQANDNINLDKILTPINVNSILNSKDFVPLKI